MPKFQSAGGVAIKAGGLEQGQRVENFCTAVRGGLDWYWGFNSRLGSKSEVKLGPFGEKLVKFQREGSQTAAWINEQNGRHKILFTSTGIHNEY